MKIKALSFRQPWAELILRGDKTMDLRTWSASWRGLMAVHSSQKVDVEACTKLGLDPKRLPNGAVLGIVNLVEVRPMDQSQYQASKGEHLEVRGFREPMYGWIFEDPQRLQAPWPARGRLKLFQVEIPDSLMKGEPAQKPPEAVGSHENAPFELFVVPDKRPSAPGMGYGMALYQRHVETPAQLRLVYANGPSQGMEKVAEVSSNRLRIIADEVMLALKEAGFKPTALSASRMEPFRLPEEVGVRLGLLFLAVRPVSKVVRSEAIAAGLQAMPTEEVYYWYSKTAYGSKAARAQRALRLLLAEE